MTTPEIEELKSLVEQEYGKILATTPTLRNSRSSSKSIQAARFHPQP